MSTPTSKSVAKSKSKSELLDLIPRLSLLPGEDAAQFEDLRKALLLDLAPGSPYEHSLAEQLFSLEWELYRCRRLRDALLIAEIRKLSEGVFHNGEVGALGYFEKDPEAEQLACDLVSGDPERMQGALQALSEHEISADEVIAKAHSSVAKSVEPHERQIAAIEVRRRKLREDYERLKAASVPPVEEAVLVAGE